MKKEAGTLNRRYLSVAQLVGESKMHGDVEKLLRDLIRAHRGLPAEHVGLDARFIEDLGFDSLNVLGLPVAA